MITESLRQAPMTIRRKIGHRKTNHLKMLQSGPSSTFVSYRLPNLPMLDCPYNRIEHPMDIECDAHATKSPAIPPERFELDTIFDSEYVNP